VHLSPPCSPAHLPSTAGAWLHPAACRPDIALQHERLHAEREHGGAGRRRRAGAGRYASVHTAAHAAAAAPRRCPPARSRCVAYHSVSRSRCCVNCVAGVPQLKIERARPPQEQAKVATKEQQQQQQQQQQQPRPKSAQSWT
jgi:alkylhydroperoxidase family enzyme